jgi:RNA polymerase sigma-70 factor (ECF subfamily)
MCKGSSIDDEFEAARSHLRSVAFRMLGSRSEADDAVQDAWMRLNRSDTAGIANLRGWLTTVVSRICLDRLRAGSSSRVDPMVDAELDLVDERPGPEHEAVRVDAIAAALVVVLDRLSAPERVAFVLRDLFGVGYDEIAALLGRSPDAARQLASRARRRLRHVEGAGVVALDRQRHLADAFLRAARHGDADALVELLAADVTLVFDRDARARVGGAEQVVGAQAVAELFAGQAQSARTALIDGEIGIVVVAAGTVAVMLSMTFEAGAIASLSAFAAPPRVTAVDVTLLDP